MAAYEPISDLDWAESAHLGDGVYALRDDEHGMFWLRTDRGLTPHVIAFDADTLAGMARWLCRQYPNNMKALAEHYLPEETK